MKNQTEETIIKHQIRDYLKLKGWFVYHNLAGLGAYKGVSDFCCTKDGVTIHAEIKKPTGTQSEYQVKFQHDLESHGGHYRILRSLKDAEEMNKFVDMAVY
jgi:hypothetical protein